MDRRRQSALAAQAREEAEALKKFDKDTQLSRLAQAKDLYDQRADLARDALAREIKLNEEAFAQGLIDAEGYVRERSRLNDEQARSELSDLEAQLAKVQAVYAANLRVSTKGLDANQRAERQEGLLEQTEKIAKLESEIEKKKRDQVEAQRALQRDAGQLAIDLRRETESIAIQLAEAQGRALTSVQIDQKVTEQFRAQVERLRKLGGDQGPLLELIDTEATKLKLAQVERDFSLAYSALQQREQAIDQDLAAGRITSAAAERQIVDLRRTEVVLLDGILDRAKQLASTPEEKQRIEGLRRQVQVLKDFQSELDQAAKSSAVNGIRTALTDIVTGAKSGKEALLDMVRSFAGAMLDVVNKRLAEELVNQAMDAIKSFKNSGTSSSGSSSGWLQALGALFATFFHTGGVVGAGGSVGRALPAAAFAFAPRYHSGGIAGLRTNEMPAVLLKGEEVLTEDDPRHIRNLQGARATPVVGSVQVVVNTEGGGSALRDRAMGQQLGNLLQVTVQRVIAQEMRPGGMLSEAARR